MTDIDSGRLNRIFSRMCEGPFADWPKRIPLDRYEEAVRLIISRWTTLKPLPIAIYQLGQINAPGFSDLDFILVFPENCRIRWDSYLPHHFPEWIHELLIHPPYCCVESSWQHLPGWYPAFNIKHLWGKKLADSKIDAKYKPGLALGMLIDYLIVKIPRDFLKVAWEQPLRLRLLVNMLHSFKYICELATRANLEVPKHVDQLIIEINSIRSHWFDYDNFRAISEIEKLTKNVILLLGTLIENAISQIAMVGDLHKGRKYSRQTFKENNGLFNFIDNWVFLRILEKSFNEFCFDKKLTWQNPIIFSYILSIYADESPDLKKFFEKKQVNLQSPFYTGKWDPGLRYHSFSMTQYGNSASELGVPPGKYIALGYCPSWPRNPKINFMKNGTKSLKAFLRMFKDGISTTIELLTSARNISTIGNIVYLLSRRKRLRKDFDFLSANNVLVIRLDQIGDIVMTSPFLRELRRNLPNAFISIVVKPDLSNLIEPCPYVDEILTFDWSVKEPLAKLRLYWRALDLARKKLWPRKFDFAILPRSDTDDYCGYSIAYFSGALWRIGYSEKDYSNRNWDYLGYDRFFSHALRVKGLKHEVEINLETLKVLGGQVSESRIELWFTKEDEEFVKRIIDESYTVPNSNKFVAFCPGAGHPGRQWPLSNFVELGRNLVSHYQNVRILVIGGPGEEHYGEWLSMNLGDKILNLINKLTLRQTVAILKECILYVGNDTGPMHLAASVGTPVIEISKHPVKGQKYSSNSPMRFAPWGVASKVLRPKRPIWPCTDSCKAMTAHCIREVTVDQVLEAVFKLI